MIENSSGLILRTRPFTETSMVVHWLTKDLGRIATVAKGALRPKSPFRGKLDLYYQGDFSFERSRRSDLHFLREVKIRQMNTALRYELGYLRQASYCTSLIEQTTETETPLPAIYDLMNSMLHSILEVPPQNQTTLAFELKLTHELGLVPNLAHTRLTPGSREIFKGLLEKPWQAILRLRLSDSQTGELSQFLHGFLIYHLGKVPKGRGTKFPCG